MHRVDQLIFTLLEKGVGINRSYWPVSRRPANHNPSFLLHICGGIVNKTNSDNCPLVSCGGLTESQSSHRELWFLSDCTKQQACVLEALGRYESYLNNKNHSFVKEYKITNLIPRRNARNSLSSVGRSEGSIRMEISLITSTSSDIAHMSIYFIFFESDIKKCFFVC